MRAVCVFCASSTRIDDRYPALAAELGHALGQRGITLVSGGGSVSMMGAVARAARAAGGHTVGVIPRALLELEVADHDADELIVTADMRDRKGVMDARADGFIVLPGGIGTLEEFTEVWTAFTLGMHTKPVVVLDPWGDYAHLRALIEHLVAQGFVRRAAADVVHWTTTVEQALAALTDAQTPTNLVDMHVHVDEAALEAD